ncbi:MAG: polysaccharide biosynthesis C-terminal domain-containing protein, partial [Bacteroidetes bacterium]|nr:polysaccharide biosynthesis C-terminal domain-containing protein [Bacteroidota bacterium]
NIELLKSFLKFGLPYFPAGLGAMLIQGIDRPILAHLTDLSTVGVYSANYKLGIFMMLFVSTFQFAWQPFFLQNEGEKNAKDIFSKVFTYFALVGSFVLVFISLFISDIVKINIFGYTIIGSDYWGGLNIVPIILLGYLFYGFYIVFTAGIYIKEKSIYIPFITFGGAFINIISNVLLIPILGLIGAALSTLVSYLFLAAALLIVTQKFYRIEYEFLRIGKIFFGIFIVAVIYYWLLNFGDLFFIYKILLSLLFIIYIFVFVVNKQEIKILKEKLFKSS